MWQWGGPLDNSTVTIEDATHSTANFQHVLSNQSCVGQNSITRTMQPLCYAVRIVARKMDRPVVSRTGQMSITTALQFHSRDMCVIARPTIAVGPTSVDDLKLCRPFVVVFSSPFAAVACRSIDLVRLLALSGGGGMLFECSQQWCRHGVPHGVQPDLRCSAIVLGHVLSKQVFLWHKTLVTTRVFDKKGAEGKRRQLRRLELSFANAVAANAAVATVARTASTVDATATSSAIAVVVFAVIVATAARTTATAATAIAATDATVVVVVVVAIVLDIVGDWAPKRRQVNANLMRATSLRSAPHETSPVVKRNARVFNHRRCWLAPVALCNHAVHWRGARCRHQPQGLRNVDAWSAEGALDACGVRLRNTSITKCFANGVSGAFVSCEYEAPALQKAGLSDCAREKGFTETCG
jgi:hypothetical protein